MMPGFVNAFHEVIFTLRLRGSGGENVETQAILDTGFNDWLTLTPAMVQALDLPFREDAEFTLADGSEAMARLFEVEI